MDNFSVPKKINRHVLKAINYLSPTGLVKRDSITTQVAYQLRNSVPVANFDHVIMMSLNNLTSLSLLRSENDEYGINRVLDERRSTTSNFKLVESPLVVRSRQSLTLHEMDVPPEMPNPMKTYKVPKRKEPDNRDLDPSTNVNTFSDVSVSGDEIDNVLKRYQTNRRFEFYGGQVQLPRKREHCSGQDDDETFANSNNNLFCFKQRHAVTNDDNTKIGNVESKIFSRPIEYSMSVCSKCKRKLRNKTLEIAKHNSSNKLNTLLNEDTVVDKGYWLFVRPNSKSNDSIRTGWVSSESIKSVKKDNNEIESTILMTAEGDDQQKEDANQEPMQIEISKSDELENNESVFYIS